MNNPEPVFSHDLANLSAEHVWQHNQIYSRPDIKVKLEAGTYHWRWCYRRSVPAGLGVTLEGDSGRYKLMLTKCWQANNVAQDIQYSDYQADIACILFSAVHEEVLCIIEQVLDDRCVVTNLDSVQFSDNPDEQKLGFRLSDQFNNVRAQGLIYMSSKQLAKINQQPGQCLKSSDRRLGRLMFSLPLQIDSVRLSYRELKTLVPGSVIKLDNNTLMENKACVLILMGVNHLVASVSKSRGKIIFNTRPENKTGDF